MKTYFRLLSFSKPLGEFVPVYLLVSVLSIAFGLLNFGLLIPLLDILFTEGRPADIPATAPEFGFNGEYVTQAFNYYFFRTAEEEGKMQALYYVCAVLIGSVLLSNVFRYIGAVMVENLRARAMRNMRNAVFSKALSLHLGFFSNERKGDLMARITTDVQEVDYSVANTFASLLKEPLTLIAYLIGLFLISVKLTLFSFVVIPISAGIIGAINKRLKKHSRAAMDVQGEMLSVAEESLGATRVIKAFNAQGFIEGKFRQKTQHQKEILGKINRRKEAASPFSELSGVLIVAIILIYGGSLVLGGDSSLKASAFVAYLALFSQVMRPAKAISSSFSNIQKGLASGERILHVIDMPVQVTDKPGATELTTFEKGIEFRDVVFSYGERRVLDGISFHLKKGQSIAMVGPSGGGKSTIADLLLRFYDPESGAVFVDGHNLTDLTAESVRQHIGLVTQESTLFHDTVFNNIAFGKPGATQAEVENAARIANAHEFIETMPEGYQTLVGDRGSRMSGGQRQRICIARAVLQNPEILILDEATSALDSESERLVQTALSTLLQGRTSLIIAHRLSTIRNADTILVIENGRVVEAGKHDALVGQSGLYSRLASLHEFA